MSERYRRITQTAIFSQFYSPGDETYAETFTVHRIRLGQGGGAYRLGNFSTRAFPVLPSVNLDTPVALAAFTTSQELHKLISPLYPGITIAHAIETGELIPYDGSSESLLEVPEREITWRYPSRLGFVGVPRASYNLANSNVLRAGNHARPVAKWTIQNVTYTDPADVIFETSEDSLYLVPFVPNLKETEFRVSAEFSFNLEALQ